MLCKMYKKAPILLILLNFIALVVSCSNGDTEKNMIDNSTVDKLDIQRYLGTWYEIARYDHRFERGLVGVTANYSMRPDGKIKVINSGYRNTLNGEFSQAEGKAKILDPVNEPGKLKVSFFWIFYGDYFVLELDPEYQWVIIGSSTDKYLWILSRTPQMDDGLYQELKNRLEERNYDVSKLIEVKQKL